MVRKTFGWSFLISWIAVSAYWHVCKIKGLCDFPLLETPQYTPVTSPEAPPPASLVISDGPQLNLHSDGHFRFAKSDPYADYRYVRKELDSLAKYLRAHVGKHLIIRGFYTSEEQNPTSFTDLGTARASNVKNIFVIQGFSDSVFTLKSELNNHFVFQQDSLTGGIAFSFTDLSASIGNKFTGDQKYVNIFKPTDLFLPATGVEYIQNTANQLFLRKAKKYLSVHTDKKLILTGNTDNKENEVGSSTVSRRLALAVKQQLMKTGIAQERIIINDKGASWSGASSDTSQSAKNNRRVTIVVQ